METSVGRVKEAAVAWLSAAAGAGDLVRSVHFDELGMDNWKSPTGAEVPAPWRELLDLAVDALKTAEVRGMTVGVIAALKIRETVPLSVDWEHGWEFLTTSLHDKEPPSLYFLRSSVLRESELDTEEHRFPVPGVPAVDHAFVRYWRGADEIANGEEYSGAVYLMRDLGAEC